MYPEILIVILPSVDGTHLEIHGNTQERIIFFTLGKILFRRVSELNNKVSLPIYMPILLLLITVKHKIKFCFQVKDIY